VGNAKKPLLNMKKIFIGFISLVILSLFSCDKEEYPERPISELEIWNCYSQSVWDNNKINNELIGKWQWVYSINYWNPDKGWNTENENTMIEFFNDSTLNLIVNNEIINTAKWTIAIKDVQLYGLVLDVSISQLYGRIIICEDILEFNNSYIDGSDNYFIKIK